HIRALGSRARQPKVLRFWARWGRPRPVGRSIAAEAHPSAGFTRVRHGGSASGEPMAETKRIAHPGTWVPTAYFAEGIPFAMVIWVAGTMFKDLGHSDSEITLATASIGLAWSLKPFWAAFLDMFRTKKFFVLLMEFS